MVRHRVRSYGIKQAHKVLIDISDCRVTFALKFKCNRYFSQPSISNHQEKTTILWFTVAGGWQELTFCAYAYQFTNFVLLLS